MDGIGALCGMPLGVVFLQRVEAAVVSVVVVAVCRNRLSASWTIPFLIDPPIPGLCSIIID